MTRFLMILVFVPAFWGCSEGLPPNIILIMADDLGYGDLGCYGAGHVKTPNIDRLAASGIRFLDYHANGAVCSPTRAALMTGRYQQRSGIEGVVTAAGHRHTGLALDEVTLADYLRTKGYKTGIIGKWHLGYDTAFSPINNGFDYFKGYVSGNIDYHSHIDQTGKYDWWLGKDTIREEGYVTDLITSAAIEFIRKCHDEPYFLFISHEAPHYPYQGRDDPAVRMIGGVFPVQGTRPDKERAYREMIEALDEGIGKLVNHLEQSGQLDHTFLFFCSDNGANTTGSNKPFRGFKGTLWEGGHRVPAMAIWQGHIEAGTCSETILSMDLFPTIISISGHRRPDNLELDGLDFSQVLYSQKTLAERPIYWRYHDQQTIRKGAWKLLVDGEELLLYNLDADPGESMNIRGKHPDLADSLHTLLRHWAMEMDQYEQHTD